MALTSVSFSWRRRSLVVSRTARVMFGREFISIILRNLSSIQPAPRDVNRNSGRNPYPKISVKLRTVSSVYTTTTLFLSRHDFGVLNRGLTFCRLFWQTSLEGGRNRLQVAV